MNSSQDSSEDSHKLIVSDDPVTLMLQKTGCIELHYKVQECIAETQDWRKCQDIVKEFKVCMQVYTNEQRKKYGN